MKIAGIIAEYNPFHSGHLYHLEMVREKTQADYIVVVMSGNFTQRGNPALLEKSLRARMALENGADLVIELPCLYATASAEAFSFGAVSLLHQLHCVDCLGFGSESGSLDALTSAASFFTNESPEFTQKLQTFLKEGLSYPAARAKVISNIDSVQNDELSSLLTQPNNILALEYLKALTQLHSTIQPVTIQRAGSGYHDKALAKEHSSAFAIRESIQTTGFTQELKASLPSFSQMASEYEKSFPIFTDDFSQLLHYKLISQREYGYSNYLDVTKDLSDKIKKNLPSFQDFDSFCMLLKSKDITYTRISRALLHILLEIPKDSVSTQVSTPYARILGFKEKSAALLGLIKKNSTIPLIAKASDVQSFLYAEEISKQSKAVLQLDLRASEIYRSVLNRKFHASFPEDFSTVLLKC